MSSLLITRPVRPFTVAASRSITRSSQPQRRGRPVVAPNSEPSSRSRSPAAPVSSVGNGPPPTRVVYAFEMPSTWSIAVGPTPEPVHAAPATQFDDVTYG